jgi:dihydropteroate synthase
MDRIAEKRYWACRDSQIEISNRTQIMGILNVTPDSFSDGGLYDDVERAVRHGVHMAEEGADIIDVGGESTRPGSETVSTRDELDRVIPVISELHTKVNIPISIDTTKSAVAAEAIRAGASIVNDISGMTFDDRMKNIVAESGAGVVMMHIKGQPKTMQQDIHYDNLIEDILSTLSFLIRAAQKAGIEPDRIVIDPGIGFGKTVEHNFEIIRELKRFHKLGRPILIGPSRKSFIGKTLNLPVDQRLEGTIAAVTACILHGADILRVHDVKQIKRSVIIADKILGKN